MNDTTLSDNPGQHRYELHKEGVIAAWADYMLATGTVVITHTEVIAAFEGQGLGSRLAAFALDDVRRRGARVLPQCEFIASWIQRHPDYVDLLA
jgi:predicted GNAT family acetyltransferase